jgi:hypothetical protein
VADREIDLICVVDGKVVLGEVKASLSEVDQDEIDSLVAVTGDLRPDVVVVGAMEGDRAKLDSKLEQVRKRVAGGIEVKGLLGEKLHAMEFHLP